MNRAREMLESYQRADAAAREELGRLLAPAGLFVTELVRDGGGWRLRLADSPSRVDAAPLPAGAVPAQLDGGVREEPIVDTTSARSAAAPLVRVAGESLMSLVGRRDERLRVTRTAGGGLRAEPAGASERVVWLGGTLVGDTVLALRHLGQLEEGPHVEAELHRQLRLFTQESTRLAGSGDPAPFLAAVDRWMPAAFPRGADFLAGGEEVARA